MKWIESSSSFTYSGKPVTRTTFKYHTPLGTFQAYEAVNGTVRYKHPFMSNAKFNGMFTYNPDPEGDIMPIIGIQVATLDIAKAKCEAIWAEIKEKINQY